MNIVANFEHRASSSRGKHEGESSFALCDRLGPDSRLGQAIQRPLFFPLEVSFQLGRGSERQHVSVINFVVLTQPGAPLQLGPLTQRQDEQERDVATELWD